MIAARLRPGDEVRVVSPAVSLGFIPEGQRTMAGERLEELGLRISYSTNAGVLDRFDSSPVEARVDDLHEAFADATVKGMLTTLGGYNSNALLDYLDYDLIRANPKILCGFSDITALATAIHAKIGLLTYSGPHFTTFGMKHGIDYTREYFVRCLMSDEPFEVLPADHWSDDLWYVDQDNRDFVPNPGYQVIHEGEVGGQTPRRQPRDPRPSCSGPRSYQIWTESILLLEDDEEDGRPRLRPRAAIPDPPTELRRRTSPCVRSVSESFEHGPRYPSRLSSRASASWTALPIVAEASFGHTTPQFTFPIGGYGAGYAPL